MKPASTPKAVMRQRLSPQSKAQAQVKIRRTLAVGDSLFARLKVVITP